MFPGLPVTDEHVEQYANEHAQMQPCIPRPAATLGRITPALPALFILSWLFMAGVMSVMPKHGALPPSAIALLLASIMFVFGTSGALCWLAIEEADPRAEEQRLTVPCLSVDVEQIDQGHQLRLCAPHGEQVIALPCDEYTAMETVAHARALVDDCNERLALASLAPAQERQAQEHALRERGERLRQIARG